MTYKTKILVVDDEPQIRKLLQVGLISYGYTIILVTNGPEALVSAVRQKPDLIVLDINLGSEPNGLEVCRQLREWSKMPIIMLTGKDDHQTKMAAFKMGADDYVTKPFGMQELEARIRAVLRRSPSDKSSPLNDEIRLRDLVLDLVKHRVTFKGREIHLTPTEYKLLSVLATQPGKVLTFKILIEALKGGLGKPRSQQYVRVYINLLRKKLKDDQMNTAHPLYIYSEPGVGYRFTDKPEFESGEFDQLTAVDSASAF